jgi:phosphoglycerate dehydrogenase-like enzyme
LSKPRVLVTIPANDINFVEKERQRLLDITDVVWNTTGRGFTELEKQNLARGVDGIICGRQGGGLSRETIQNCKTLKIIGVIGGTVKLVNAEYALDLGITIINTAPAMAHAVAEFTLALILNAMRDIP